MGMKGDREGIQAVEVAGLILSVMTSAARPLPLKEIARFAAIHPSKVHRYLVSLSRSGLVAQEHISGHYVIGPSAIALGLAGISSFNIVRCSGEYMPALRDEVDETVILSIWTKAGPIIALVEETKRFDFLQFKVGAILPVLQTAVGRVFAAYLPHSEVMPILNKETLMPKERQLLKESEIQQQLSSIRRAGYDKRSGALLPIFAAVAAPIFDYRNEIAGVLALAGSPTDLAGSALSKKIKALLRTSTMIGKRIGYPG